MISLSLISMLQWDASWAALQKTRSPKQKRPAAGANGPLYGNRSRVTEPARDGHPVVAKTKIWTCVAM
jgi:hypothetical protein